MAFLSKSLHSTSSPGGFKSCCNLKRILFCCSKTDEDGDINETTVILESKHNGIHTVDRINSEKEKENNEKYGSIETEIRSIKERQDEINQGFISGQEKNDEMEISIDNINHHSNDISVESRKVEKDEIKTEDILLKIQESEIDLETSSIGDEDIVDIHSEDESITVRDEPRQKPNFHQQLVDNLIQVKSQRDIPEDESQDELPEAHEQVLPEDYNSQDYASSQGEDFENMSDHGLNVDALGKPEKETKTGDLRLKVGLSSDRTSLVLTIFESHDYARPSSSTNSIREHLNAEIQPVLAYSVHVVVMQLKKQRYKTKMRQGPDPYFDETIKIPKVNPVEAKKWCLRFRLYGSLRNLMKQIIGEGFLPLSKIDIDARTQCDIALVSHNPNISKSSMDTLISANPCKFESRNSLVTVDKNSNALESGSVPELMVGLAINTNSGRLTIDIKRGTAFPKLKDNKSPDTFIKVVLNDSKGNEMFNSKTTSKKASCNPEFEETFIFQVLMFQIDEITLIIQGYQKLKMGKKFMFGTITIGSKADNEEGRSHWNDFVTSKTSEQIIKWHSFELKRN